MEQLPETRHSLLVRLRDHRDAQAWSDFLDIYRPLVYRLIRRKGFQDTDAEELTQEALIAVAGAIESWEPDPERGSFRGWLFRIARNMMINFLSRSRPENRGIGGNGFEQLLAEQAAESPEETTVFGLEYRRQVFAWAARQVSAEFSDSTWQAFWRTSVEGHEIKIVAGELGLSTGAVYVARSRVMARLAQKVKQFEERSSSNGAP